MVKQYNTTTAYRPQLSPVTFFTTVTVKPVSKKKNNKKKMPPSTAKIWSHKDCCLWWQISIFTKYKTCRESTSTWSFKTIFCSSGLRRQVHTFTTHIEDEHFPYQLSNFLLENLYSSPPLIRTLLLPKYFVFIKQVSFGEKEHHMPSKY